MKLAYIPLLAATLMVASAEVQWYVGDRDITCTGHDDGNISCEHGHIGGAEEVGIHNSLDSLPLASCYSIIFLCFTPNREATPLLHTHERILPHCTFI